MSEHVMIALALANGAPSPIKLPAYVKSYDPDANHGRGYVAFTEDVEQALTFQSLPEAWERWRTISTVRPRRADGKPNRPLSAYTVTITSKALAEQEKARFACPPNTTTAP